MNDVFNCLIYDDKEVSHISQALRTCGGETFTSIISLVDKISLILNVDKLKQLFRIMN